MIGILREVLGEDDAAQYTLHIRTKQQLILQQRLLADTINTTNSQIAAVQQL